MDDIDLEAIATIRKNAAKGVPADALPFALILLTNVLDRGCD